MYLSALEINTGLPAGRMWLSNPYRVHQRLALAFADPAAERILFRIEDQRQQPRILVQTRHEPDWVRAFADLPILVGARAKQVTLAPQPGQRLRFLLRANPTERRLAPRELDADGKRKVGPRYGLLKEEEQREWLARKGAGCGFRPLDYEVRSAGQLSFRRGRGEGVGTQTHVSVAYEGVLEVTDAAAFVAAIEAGLGAAKAFGFGLLSVAPA